MGTLHPDMSILTEAQKGAYGGATIAEQREAWGRYTASIAEPPPDTLAVRDMVLPGTHHPTGHRVPVRVYRPKAAAGAVPCVIYMHGGGFMKGDLDSSDPIAWGFAAQTGAVVVSVDYRLTPEHPYPAAFHDCLAVLRHLAAEPGEFGIDPARIGVAGDSAGGHLAASLCLAARDGIAPAPVCQAVIYTVTGTDMTMPSYMDNATGYGLTTAACRDYYRILLTRPEDQADPHARPAIVEDLARLPPAFVHSAEFDPVRDDGRLYAARLALSGVDVTYREARGMIHGFMRARFKGAAARAEYDAICDFLRERL
jgi:acetyl esterase